MLSIRQEAARDFAAIRDVNEEAFGQAEEADIVEKLRNSGTSVLSLVATRNDRVVGHIQFSPVIIEHDGGVIEGVGLAPMAVLPDYQNQGIGSALVEAGIRALGERSCPFMIVLGHPNYYPRFGFERASRHGIVSEWKDIPVDVFMLLILDENVMKNVAGEARYGAEFNEAG